MAAKQDEFLPDYEYDIDEAQEEVKKPGDGK